MKIVHVPMRDMLMRAQPLKNKVHQELNRKYMLKV